MERLLVIAVLTLGVVLPAFAQKTHARYHTRVRQHAWLRRSAVDRPPQDLRSHAERQHDYQVYLHYSREAQLDAIAALATEHHEEALLARVEAVRRVERDRFRRALRALMRDPQATPATVPDDFARPTLVYEQARSKVTPSNVGAATDSLADLQRQVLREKKDTPDGDSE